MMGRHRSRPLVVSLVVALLVFASATTAFVQSPLRCPSHRAALSRAKPAVALHSLSRRPATRLFSQKAEGDDILDAEVVAEAPEGGTKKKSPLQFLKSKFTRKNLSAAGLSLFLSYGFVSNVNSAAMMGWVWAKYVKDTGLSPFIGWHPPFVTPKFLAYYGAIYITLGSLLRPVRAAIATGLSPIFNRFIEGLQKNFKFSKPMAVFTVIFMGNIVFTIGWLLFNVRVACWVFRVPVAPAAAL